MSSLLRPNESYRPLEVRRGDWMVLLSAVCFSTMPIFGSFAYAAGMGVYSLLAWRFLLAVTMLSGMLVVSGRLSPLPKEKLAGFIGMGAMYFVMSFLYFQALKLAPISTLTLLFYTYPAIVTVLAAILLKERISRVKATALALALGGCLLVLRPSELGSGRGAAFALVASGMYSGFLLWGTPLTRGTDAVLCTTLILSVSGIGYVVVALFRRDLEIPRGTAAWAPILGLAAVSTVMSDVLFFWGLPRTGASRAAILSTLEPACTLALSGLFLGESIPPARLLGGALILASVVLIHRE
ncbi:MAG TPA: DMT family transporter [Candidatus Polarisedimenticolia bacterium]|nr:DMT family transporter [Candidatus Polarisedimenticolia bacterium]